MHYHRVCMRHQQHGGGQPSSHSYRKGTVKRSRKKCLNWQILLVPPRARAVCTSERGYVSRNLHLVRAVGHPHILRWRTAKQPELQQKEASELAKSPRSAKSKSCGDSPSRTSPT
ncbi:uncharacterized protein LOC115339608 isoform X7 [Aquila chrysaetos chrysaetos]|uniref:uncharacterized protein LOC115339608 isoform X7 n=1 Tax=Aquila chrysaetos chrysaetos TaxID=223781 RepID=UPI0011769518|nr:uncharacterized protein LOC115339608 isoform X7 [Aquila chrysaetos chrysaetos]